MDPWWIAIITAVISIMASSGFWEFWIHRKKKDTAESRLLRGLAHDRILFLGTSYIHRGYVTKEEYDDLNSYLYEPYREAGGNGSAEKIMKEVYNLPTYKPIYPSKEKYDKGGQ